MAKLIDILVQIDQFLWSRILLILLLVLGLYLTFRLKGMQFKYLGYSLKLAFSRNDDECKGDISQFQSLMTALAATIGIGSIAGVATAIIGGGFGAIFWMWIIALLGMVTKYAEAILAVKYRQVDSQGKMAGGPMYYIRHGLNWKLLAGSFAFFGILATFFGGNMIQSNSIAAATEKLLPLTPFWIGIILMGATATVLIGGIQSIGRVCAYLVPIMASMYILGGLLVIFRNLAAVPSVFKLIFYSAFTGQAAIGGFVGSSLFLALQFGVARGISSNEAGLGSAPIAAAAAKTDTPGRQAMISMSGVFLSTMVVCTITALVVGVTNVQGMLDHAGSMLNGATLVMQAFKQAIPSGDVIVAVGLILFGYSTILGWAYYGEKCVEYLAGLRWISMYRIIFSIVVFLGAILHFDLVWSLADIANGLMAFPNLIGLFALSKIVIEDSKIFFAKIEQEQQYVQGLS